VSGLADLEGELGRAAPACLAGLGDDALHDLAGMFRDARAAQADALESALETSLRLAPRPLRPVLRKVLLG
jgi:hypothetical protein